MAGRGAFAFAKPCAPEAGKAFRAFARVVAGLALALSLALITPAREAAAQPVKGTASAVVENGFARLLFNLGTDIESQARLANNVVVISFDRPVDVNVDHLREGAPDYIGAARRDPDGKAVRIALTKRVTMNSMLAGERLYVDLLPDSWTGLPPGLPREVIEELARRARDAEKKLRQDRPAVERKVAQIRVRVATQPTFTRYVFQLPEPIGVAADNGKDKLTLTFNATLNFDLADAQAALPAALQSIDSELDQDTAVVRFAFKGKVDVRTFREDNNYVVDVSSAEAERQLDARPADQLAALATDLMARKAPPAANIEAPQTVPAKDSPGAALFPAVPRAAPRTASPAAAPKAAPANAASSNAPAPAAAAPSTPSPSTPSPSAPAPSMPSPPAPIAAAPVLVPTPTPAAPSLPASSVEATPSLAAASPPAQSGPAAPNPAAPSPTVPSPVAPPPAVQNPVALGPVLQSPVAPSSVAPVSVAPDLAGAGVPASISPAPSASPPPVAEPATDAAAAPLDPNAIRVAAKQQGENVSLRFPFAGPTPAAVFNRADMLWLVFDTKADIDLAALKDDQSHTIKSATVTRQQGAAVVRIRLERPRLTSVATDGPAWIINIGSEAGDQLRSLAVTRSSAGSEQANITVAMADPRALHRLADPEASDQLLVVTALAPARGFVNSQDFVEFRVLPSVQGIVVEPLADDIKLALFSDRVSLTRPGGLTLSGLQPADRGRKDEDAGVLSPDSWTFERQSDFGQRESLLLFAAAKANESQRLAARVDLARFYLAWERSEEAKGVLDVAIKDNPPSAADPVPLVMRAVADILMERPQEALKDLSSPLIGEQYEAPLWRAWAYAQQNRWADAREGFRDADARLPRLPVELQRKVLQEILQVSLESGDLTGALSVMNQFDVIGVPADLQPTMAIYNGEISERLGRDSDALQSYQLAADSWDRQAAAEGQLHEIKLKNMLGQMRRSDAIDGLEALTTIWRGDDTETEALKLLAHLYTQDGRYRDSFHVMRIALSAHPNSDGTHRIQDEAAETFENLFLAGSGDALSAIDALSLFYDFSDLTPIGRRGDEMIRRLADRLVAVDLLDQAAALLQYQVDHRLQGAARAQVAVRLALIYLMNHKPQDAFAALRATRVEDLSNELRQQRLLLEARALSDTGRHDVALEIIGNIDTPQARKLRADILWAGKRWDDAAEQIEISFGDRWKGFAPFNDAERSQVLRAAAGYALGGDKLGLARFRERFGGKMGEGPDHRAFDVITAPVDANGSDFRAVAHQVAAVDTLRSFLQDMQTRYPQSGPSAPAAPPDTVPTGSTRPPVSRTAAR